MESQTAQILQAISRMTQSEGWQYLKRDFQFVIDQLQDQINEPGGNEMKYSEGDLLKIKLRLMNEVLDYPDKFISMAQKPVEIENEDPYKDK